MKPRFLDYAAYGDLFAVGVEAHRNAMRRLVGDAPVQRILQPAGFLVKLRRTIAFQSAADQQFVEAVEPAQPARLAQVDEGRMHWSAHRRLPANRPAGQTRLPEAHA